MCVTILDSSFLRMSGTMASSFGIARHEDQERPLVIGASEHVVEEAHRTGGVGQRGQSGIGGAR